MKRAVWIITKIRQKYKINTCAFYFCGKIDLLRLRYAIKVNYIGSILAIVIGIICLVGNVLADKRCQKLRLIKLDK